MKAARMLGHNPALHEHTQEVYIFSESEYGDVFTLSDPATLFNIVRALGDKCMISVVPEIDCADSVMVSTGRWQVYGPYTPHVDTEDSYEAAVISAVRVANIDL